MGDTGGSLVFTREPIRQSRKKKKRMEKIRWKRDGKRMEKEEAWSTENGRVETQAASFDRNSLAAKTLSPSFLT